MRLLRILCFLDLHPWKVQHTGKVPGAHVKQYYCPLCRAVTISHDVYDVDAWERWLLSTSSTTPADMETH